VFTLALIVHVIVSIALILIVLLQFGRGASLGAAFGGASQTIFGSSGPASFLNKITTVAAVIFMITSMALAMMSAKRGSGSIVPLKSQPAATQPVVPPSSPQEPAPQPAAPR